MDKAQRNRTESGFEESPGATIGALKFPVLNRQSVLDPDVKTDLALTEVEFGRKYKRGKAKRLEALEVMENRLAVIALRAARTDVEQFMNQVDELLRANELGIGRSLAVPQNAAEAEVVFRLTFLRLGASGPEFALNLTAMLASLADLVSRAIPIDIFRTLVTDVEGSETAQTLADRYGKGRQAIYDRQDRMIDKLDELRSSTDFSTLSRYLRENAIVFHTGKMSTSLAHPLVAIAAMDRGNFPSVHDVVAFGLWAVAREETGTKKSFRRIRGERNTDLELQI